MNMETTIAPRVSSDIPLSTTHHHMEMKPMWMWFHTTINDVVLFESWTITTPGGMIWTCFVVMAMGVLLEFVRYVRWRFELQSRKDIQLYTSYLSRLFSFSHFLQTSCFAVQLVLSYLLMLIFMTFSVWLGLSVCIGAGIGFLLFGSRQGKQSTSAAVTDRCC
ncbi:hypothetical protein RB195_005390 [Necator americanus]|uniref:Copper transport protein n=1 Tax=Necator americanus TaxID=51031 RepID=A0ABR1BRF2_NECAM